MRAWGAWVSEQARACVREVRACVSAGVSSFYVRRPPTRDTFRVQFWVGGFPDVTIERSHLLFHVADPLLQRNVSEFPVIHQEDVKNYEARLQACERQHKTLSDTIHRAKDSKCVE